MGKILIPASSVEDWKRLLADPEKQWKTGYSARTLAYCWQKANGIPKDVLPVLEKEKSLEGLEAILIIPEHKVPLEGGSKASQNDIWILAKADEVLVSITVEGKVSESFGPTVGGWLKNKTPGKEARLKFLCKELCLEYPPSHEIRYQLLHRTASAIIEAKQFRTNTAVMLVHSFSKTDKGLKDYQAFVSLFGLKAEKDQPVSVTIKSGINLIFAWVHGDEKYLNS